MNRKVYKYIVNYTSNDGKTKSDELISAYPIKNNEDLEIVKGLIIKRHPEYGEIKSIQVRELYNRRRGGIIDGI